MDTFPMHLNHHHRQIKPLMSVVNLRGHLQFTDKEQHIFTAPASNLGFSDLAPRSTTTPSSFPPSPFPFPHRFTAFPFRFPPTGTPRSHTPDYPQMLMLQALRRSAEPSLISHPDAPQSSVPSMPSLLPASKSYDPDSLD